MELGLGLRPIAKAIQQKYHWVTEIKVKSYLENGYLKALDNPIDVLDEINGGFDSSDLLCEILNMPIRKVDIGKTPVEAYIEGFSNIIKYKNIYVILDYKLLDLLEMQKDLFNEKSIIREGV